MCNFNFDEILNNVKRLADAGYEISSSDATIEQVEDYIDELADKLKAYAKSNTMQAFGVEDVQQRTLELFDSVHYAGVTNEGDYRIEDIAYDEEYDSLILTLESYNGSIEITQDEASQLCTKIED